MERPRIGAFSLVVFFGWFSLYAYLPILPAYARELGASYEMVGLIVGGYGFTQMVLRLPLGILSDKWRKRKIFIIAGMAFCMISGAGMLLFPTVLSLLLFRALAGVAATTWVVQTVLYASYFPATESAKAIGRVNAFSTAGQMVATLIGGFIAYYFGDAYTFLLAAAGGAAALLLSLSISENCPVERKAITLADIVRIGKDNALVSASVLALVMQVVTYGTAYGFIPIAGKNLGANSFQIGLLPTLFMVPGVLASMTCGTFFVPRFGKKMAVVLGYFAMAAPVLAIPFITDLYMLYLTQMLSGFGRGLAFPLLMQHSVTHIDAHQKATAMGYFQSIYGMGMFLGPIIVGILGDRLGLSWGFGVIGCIGLIGTAAAALWLVPAKSAVQAPSV